jgi:hypothetical protein
MSRSTLFDFSASTRRRLVLFCTLGVLAIAGASLVKGTRAGPEQSASGSVGLMSVGGAAPVANSTPVVAPVETPLPVSDPNSTVCALAC